MTDDLQPVWEAYWADRSDPEPIDLLMRAYAGLAGYYARVAIAKAPPHQDRDDILSYAQHGLLQAIERYDPNRGAKFETWAARTIPNRIMDRQRKDDPLTRPMRSKVKLLEAVQAEAPPGETFGITEIADRMKISEDEARGILVFATSMNTNYDEAGESGADHHTMADSDAEMLVRMGEVRSYVAARLSSLGPRQRAFLLAYYCDTDAGETKNKSLVQTCSELGISPDWARQTRNQVLQAIQR